MNTYAVEIGCALWDQLYSYLETNYRQGEDCCSEYRVEGIYEEESQKFAILQHRSSGKYYQLNFDITEENGFAPAGELFEVTQTYVPAAEPQFSLDAVAEYEAARYAVTEEPAPAEEMTDDAPTEETPISEPEEVPAAEPVASYNLEEITEYVELRTRYNELESKYNDLVISSEQLNTQISELTSFKANIEKKEKEKMIQSFYMLSDEDKKDVIDNINSYSIDEIEAKLSVICVRNKVSFNLEEDNTNGNDPMTYNLNSTEVEDLSIPAWLKAVQAVAETL